MIIVLDHGRVLEAGNHDQLLAKQGYYYELYTGKKKKSNKSESYVLLKSKSECTSKYALFGILVKIKGTI